MAAKPLTANFILALHKLLLSDSCDHKCKEVITSEYGTASPKDNPKVFSKPTRIRPFDEANGRIGCLIMFKECLRHDIVPFIIDDKRRSRYLEGIKNRKDNPAILEEVALEAQKRYQSQIELQILIARHHEMNPGIDRDT